MNRVSVIVDHVIYFSMMGIYSFFFPFQNLSNCFVYTPLIILLYSDYFFLLFFSSILSIFICFFINFRSYLLQTVLIVLN